MTTNKDLLPCPFCGDLAWMEVYPRVLNGSDGFRVECQGRCHSMTCYWHTEEEAAEIWNTRAASQPEPTVACKEGYNAGFRFANETMSKPVEVTVDKMISQAYDAIQHWDGDSQLEVLSTPLECALEGYIRSLSEKYPNGLIVKE